MIDIAKDITLVIGVDAKTIEQLKISLPTWRKNRPEIFQWPWLIFFDGILGTEATKTALKSCGLDEINSRLFKWQPELAGTIEYESQRERMLTGHVYVPAVRCDTSYYCKIDTDVLAKSGSEIWPDPEWFEGDPGVIAPRWHYSKGIDWLGRLEDWGANVPVLSEMPALGCRNWEGYSPTAKRVGHARWCSWLSFYKTSFAKLTCHLCEQSVGNFKLPVPSQDTTHWYIAERMQLPVKIAGQKGRGWTTVPRIEELRHSAAEIMKA